MFYPNTSAYAATTQNKSFLGRYAHRTITIGADDKTITIDSKYNLRPDLLSYDLYGTSELWWVFCSRNLKVIRDPVWDFTAGTQIVVSSRGHLSAILGI